MVASDREEQDYFGVTVSISGNYAIIGVPGEGDDVFFNTDIGSAYIFERAMDGTWNEVQKIRASDENGRDQFGSSVSISGDFAIVGAYKEDEDINGINTLNDAGSAYIFKSDAGGVWNEVQKIVASDREDSVLFGSSVSLSGDYAVVGAYLEDKDVSGVNILSNAGAAYIFKKDVGGVWSETQKVVATDRNTDDYFGSSVSISDDYVVIGAPAEDEDALDGNTKSNSGSAYIFKRDIGGVWSETQKIVASDRNIDDSFGDSFIDGDYIIVGASSEDENESGNNTLNKAGSAYVFKRDISGIWNQTQKLVASDRSELDRFGSALAIIGNYAVIGASSAGFDDIDMVRGGAVYMYNLSPPLSVLENDFGSLLKVYNPTNGEITIDLGVNYDSIELKVVNSIAQKLLTKTYKATHLVNFEIRGAKGIYFVTISTASGKKATVKVLKE